MICFDIYRYSICTDISYFSFVNIIYTLRVIAIQILQSGAPPTTALDFTR